jgi:xanthine dehydrogenase YagR molybdenum-binding subunit
MRPQAQIQPDHLLVVGLATIDIGTGLYTIPTQIAAETMKMPVDRVTDLMGDTNNTLNQGSGGSVGAATSGAAVRVLPRPPPPIE